MKYIVIATALAVLAGCAGLPESVKHPFAGQGATTQRDSAPATQENFRYPYNSPYGV